jgi:hypothetical protein
MWGGRWVRITMPLPLHYFGLPLILYTNTEDKKKQSGSIPRANPSPPTPNPVLSCSGMDEQAYLRRCCPWWSLQPGAPEPGSEDALAARGRPGGPRVVKPGVRRGIAHLRSTRKESAGAPQILSAQAREPPLAAANRAPHCPAPQRPLMALPLPPQRAAPARARLGALGGKLGAAGETRSDAAAVAAVPRPDRRPHQGPHPLQALRSNPDPRRDLQSPLAPPAETSASSKISPVASCPPPRPSLRGRRGTQVSQARAGGGGDTMLRAGGAEPRAVPGVGLRARGGRASLARVQWPVAGGGARGKRSSLSAAPHAGCGRRVGRLRGWCPRLSAPGPG